MSFTDVPGSHECLDYNAEHYCAKTSQFSVKSNIAIFIRRGTFCHLIWDRFCHLLWSWFLVSLINNNYRWLWSWLAIRVHPDCCCSESPIKKSALPQITENLVLELYVSVILHIVDDDEEWNVLCPRDSLGDICWQNLPHIWDRYCQMRHHHIINASVEITEKQLKPSTYTSLEALATHNQPVKY